MKIKLIAASAILVFASVLFGQERYFLGDSEKNPLEYKCGETMKFNILYMEDGKPVAGQKYKWSIISDDGSPERSGTGISTLTPMRFEAKISTPGFVRLMVTAVDDNGKSLMLKGNRILFFNGGAGAEIEKLKNAVEEPEDFDAFWKRQLDAQSKVPLKCEKKFLDKYSKGNFNVYALSVDCVGKPAKAFLSIPKNAAKKSLPIKAMFVGYGVGRIEPKTIDGAITLMVLRHSYEPLRETKYYQDMKNGPLKGFGLSAADHADPEKCYFKFMVLRDLRALEYVKKHVPEWNGKDIETSGGSMGGFQAIFVAALDKDVTFCSPNVPWMTDLWAADNASTRIPSGFRPEWTPGIRYFDSTFAVKRVKCPIAISAWLGDYVCPPSGIAVLYNNARSPVSLNFGQNGIHSGSCSPKTSAHYTIKKNQN